MNILSAIVVDMPGVDRVILNSNLPQQLKGCEGNLKLAFSVDKGQGVSYVKTHFGLDAETVNFFTWEKNKD